MRTGVLYPTSRMSTEHNGWTNDWFINDVGVVLQQITKKNKKRGIGNHNYQYHHPLINCRAIV